MKYSIIILSILLSFAGVSQTPVKCIMKTKGNDGPEEKVFANRLIENDKWVKKAKGSEYVDYKSIISKAIKVDVAGVEFIESVMDGPNYQVGTIDFEKASILEDIEYNGGSKWFRGIIKIKDKKGVLNELLSTVKPLIVGNKSNTYFYFKNGDMVYIVGEDNFVNKFNIDKIYFPSGKLYFISCKQKSIEWMMSGRVNHIIEWEKELDITTMDQGKFIKEYEDYYLYGGKDPRDVNGPIHPFDSIIIKDIVIDTTTFTYDIITECNGREAVLANMDLFDGGLENDSVQSSELFLMLTDDYYQKKKIQAFCKTLGFEMNNDGGNGPLCTFYSYNPIENLKEYIAHSGKMGFKKGIEKINAKNDSGKKLNAEIIAKYGSKYGNAVIGGMLLEGMSKEMFMVATRNLWTVIQSVQEGGYEAFYMKSVLSSSRIVVRFKDDKLFSQSVYSGH